MLLNGNTVQNLEIYRNTTDWTERGSLFWVLNRTKTKFGRRLLRDWVGRPLINIEQVHLHAYFFIIKTNTSLYIFSMIKERQIAIDQIKEGKNQCIFKLRDLLQGMPDIERVCFSYLYKVTFIYRSIKILVLGTLKSPLWEGRYS